MIDFRLTDQAGRTIADPAEQAGGTVNVKLNDRRTANTVLGFDEPAAQDADALRSILRASLDGAPLFAGTVLRPQYGFAARRVTLPAVDPVARLAAAFVGGRSDGAGLPGTVPGYSYRWDGLDQGEMIARLVEHASPTAAELAAGVPDHGVIRGLIEATLPRDRQYEAGKQVWEAIAQISAVRDGVDVELEPVDDGTPAIARLNTRAQQGTDRTADVVLECGWGAENCSPPVIEEAGDLVRNRSIRSGRQETGQPTPLARRDNFTSQQQVGIWGEYLGETDVADEATLAQHADAVVGAYATPPLLFTVAPNQDAPPFGPRGAYWVGDAIRLDVRDQPSGLRFDLIGRVLEATLANLPNGQVGVGLVCGPIVGGGYRVRGARPPGLVQGLASLAERLRLSTIT